MFLRHYSYECKATTQERPYTSRPSRTQQLLNPKLAPKLASDVPNDLIRKKGVADEQLAKLEESRGRTKDRSLSPAPMASTSRKRSRSMSSYSSDSVSTISTTRSTSPKRARRRDRDSFSDYQSRPMKRRYSSSALSRSRSRSRSNSVLEDDFDRPSDGKRSSEANQRRRHQMASPEPRGRPESQRRGSRRTKSRSPGLDKSRIARARKSITPGIDGYTANGARYGAHLDARSKTQPGQGHEADARGGRRSDHRPPPRKERSLSPFSKRLALTQAMNSK